MKVLYLLLILLAINGCTNEMPVKNNTQNTPKKHSFQDIWQ